RPGEKLKEELVAAEEEIAGSYHERIKALRGSEPAPSNAWLTALQAHVEAGDAGEAVRLLHGLVPSFQPSAFLLERLADADASGGLVKTLCLQAKRWTALLPSSFTAMTSSLNRLPSSWK